MNINQELFEEIKKALQENDQATLNILLQDQERCLLQSFLNRIEDLNMKSRFADYLTKWNLLNQQQKMKVQSDDKIRKINIGKEQDKQQSEEDIVEQQIKRKKMVKIQQKAGYAFYGNVKCLMKSYGDLAPIEQSVKMMHSEVHILFELVFKFISKLEESEKINQSSLRKLIEAVFKDQCECFEKITKQYKKATKSTKTKEQVYESSQQQDQFPDEKKEINPSSHMNANTFEQSKYLASITKNMTESQYQSYSECRSVNFLQNNKSSKSTQDLNKFVKFLDPSQEVLKPNMRLLELLSFICCRFIRKIIFEIKRTKNGGVLELSTDPISSDEIKKIGNKILEDYQKQFQSMKNSKENTTNHIKQLFVSDFQNSDFRTAFPKKYINSNKTAEQIWHENSHYRQMWTQRYKAQNQVQQRIAEIEKQQFEVSTQYGKFIIKNLDAYKKRGSLFLWKKYFTQQKITDEPQKNQQTQGRPRKRVKLQSLRQQK